MSKRSNGHAVVLPADKHRLQIPVTAKQRVALVAAAERAGSDLNTWSLAHMMRAAGVASGPIVLTGEVADRVRRLAAEQDISPSKAVEQLLLSVEVE